MLKNKTKIIAFFLVLVLFFSATIVLAQNETNDEVMPISSESDENQDSTPELSEDTYKKSDVYLTGDDVIIDYIVDGNAFICADTVTINSQIGGDAFIMANKIVIEEEGYVYNNLFAIADEIEIKGVAYDVYSFSKTLTISNSYIYRDVKCVCDTLNVNAPIGRNVFAKCDTINFNTIENSNGSIYGNLNYSADSELSIPEEVVHGEISYDASLFSSKLSVGEIIGLSILNLGNFLILTIIIWLVCLWLTPKFLTNTNQFVGKKTLTILGTGLLTLIAIPVISIILVLLQITNVFSVVLLTLYILALIISKSLFVIVANNYICSKLKINRNLGIFGILIISGIVVWLLTQIPYVGFVISLIITVLGLGVLVNPIISKLPKKTAKNDTVEEVVEVSDYSKTSKKPKKSKKSEDIEDIEE